MSGSHSLKKILESYPVIVPIICIVVILLVAIKVVRHFQQERARAKVRECRIQEAKDAMLKCYGFEDFYDAFGGYLDAVRHQVEAAEYQNLSLIIKATGNVDIAFELEGLDWTLAHWSASDFDVMVDGAKLLGLEKLIEPMRQAQAQFHERDLLYQSANSETDHKQFQKHLGSIEAEFAALGGAPLFRETANKRLRKKMNNMLLK